MSKRGRRVVEPGSSGVDEDEGPSSLPRTSRRASTKRKRVDVDVEKSAVMTTRKSRRTKTRDPHSEDGSARESSLTSRGPRSEDDKKDLSREASAPGMDEAEGSKEVVSRSADLALDLASARRKLDRLKELRTTEAEKLYDAARSILKEKDEVFKKTFSQTTKSTRELERQLEGSRIREKELEAKGMLTLPRLVEALVEENRMRDSAGSSSSVDPLMRFYRALTTLQLSPQADPNWCLAVLKASKRKGFKFRFGLSADDEFEYIPLENSFSSNLPDFLQDEITFNKDQAPVFFAKLLHFYLNTKQNT